MFTKLASLALHLDAIVEELLKVGTVEYTVRSGLGVVDHEFVLGSNSFCSGLWLRGRKPGISLLRRKLSKAVPGGLTMVGRRGRSLEDVDCED